MDEYFLLAIWKVFKLHAHKYVTCRAADELSETIIYNLDYIPMLCCSATCLFLNFKLNQDILRHACQVCSKPSTSHTI